MNRLPPGVYKNFKSIESIRDDTHVITLENGLMILVKFSTEYIDTTQISHFRVIPPILVGDCTTTLTLHLFMGFSFPLEYKIILSKEDLVEELI